MQGLMPLSGFQGGWQAHFAAWHGPLMGIAERRQSLRAIRMEDRLCVVSQVDLRRNWKTSRVVVLASAKAGKRDHAVGRAPTWHPQDLTPLSTCFSVVKAVTERGLASSASRDQPLKVDRSKP